MSQARIMRSLKFCVYRAASQTTSRPISSPHIRNVLSSSRRSSYRSWSSSIARPRPQSQGQDVFYSQLEDPQSAAILSSSKKAIPQTVTEKIVQKHAVGLPEGKFVKSGDFVTIAPHRCMTHDNSFPVRSKFMSIGATKIKDPKQIVCTIDHDVQNRSSGNLSKYKQIEEFATKHGLDFYPAGRGIGHQIMVETAHAFPGTMVVASDSHSNHYGAIGCLGTPVVRTDAASIWASSMTWWQVPPIAKVTFTGVLPKGVTGKDVIVALCGLFNKDDVLNHAIEFAGSEETMRSLPIDSRMTIANMTTEFGALSGLFPMDQMLQAWLRSKATMAAIDESEGRVPVTGDRLMHSQIDALFEAPLQADKGAQYAKYLYLDLSTLSPYVSGPNSVKVATPLNELEAQDIKINKAYLVSCTNSRASDIAAAANVFRQAAEKNGGKTPKVADGVQFYLAAASTLEQQTAEEAGDWQVLLDAGCHLLPAGCGPCIGLGAGLLEPGEVGISASNRNFKGRMGSPDALAYLASPEVVAASALSGKISGPGWYEKPEGWKGVKYGEGDGVKEEDRMITADEALQKILNQLDSIVETAEKEFGDEETTEVTTGSTEIYPGFPERIQGTIVFCDADNLNTDGIYPGKYTYQDDVSVEKMAEVCMENYDPQFSSIAKAGDILVSGYNFGCGSSREQAATAILAKKIPMVFAGSFGNIFSRNSINNALMGLEVPKLVERLRETFSAPPRPVSDEITEPHGNKENQQSLDSPPPAPVQPSQKKLTIRTGWTLVWDVRKSQIEVTEGEGGKKWTEKVGEVPPNVQEIIAKGGLEKWVRAKIQSES